MKVKVEGVSAVTPSAIWSPKRQPPSGSIDGLLSWNRWEKVDCVIFFIIKKKMVCMDVQVAEGSSSKSKVISIINRI